MSTAIVVVVQPGDLAAWTGAVSGLTAIILGACSLRSQAGCVTAGTPLATARGKVRGRWAPDD
jgi:hypothetical protein